jgi:hypothetical protein
VHDAFPLAPYISAEPVKRILGTCLFSASDTHVPRPQCPLCKAPDWTPTRSMSCLRSVLSLFCFFSLFLGAGALMKIQGVGRILDQESWQVRGESVCACGQPAFFHCGDCSLPDLCRKCMVDAHANVPFHDLRVSAFAGLRFFLGAALMIKSTFRSGAIASITTPTRTFATWD